MAAKKKPTKKAKPVARKAPAKKPASKPKAKLVRAKPKSKPKPVKARKPAPKPVEHDEEVDEVREIFDTYDRDGSGHVDRSEFSRLLEALGMEIGDDELTIALSVVDADDSGKISWDEFKSWWTSR